MKIKPKKHQGYTISNDELRRKNMEKEFNLEKAKERWEKAFEKEMTDEEFVMFNWGYTYAINDSLEGR